MSANNPFAPPTAPVADSIEGSRDAGGEIKTEALYRAAVGPFANGYVQKFVRFSASETTRRSWNFAAMIFGFFWFLYRRMYIAAFLVCIIGPAVLLYVPRMVMAGLGFSSAYITVITTVLYSWVLIPLYADYLYYTAIERRIVLLKEKHADDGDVLRALQLSKPVNPIAVVCVCGARRGRSKSVAKILARSRP